MTEIKIALERYMNPTHFPLLALQDYANSFSSTYKIMFVEPDSNYESTEALSKGNVDMMVIEPMYLLTATNVNVKSIGTYFSTNSGVLIAESSRSKLLRREQIKVSSSFVHENTNKICRSILNGWLVRQGRKLYNGQVDVLPNGFELVKALQNGWDASWLSFSNQELVEAQKKGIHAELITCADAGIPELSALEIVYRRDDPPERQALYDKVVRRLELIILELSAQQPTITRSLWYSLSKTKPSEVVDAIVDATVKCVHSHICPSKSRWHPLWEYVRSIDDNTIDQDAFDAIFE